jgi:photosystem II stability/assembly factor-like uncharacterized protein
MMEALDVRQLLTSTFGYPWGPFGPAPIETGQTPGNLPCTGRVAAITAHPTNPNIIYVASASGGVWRTVNGGTSWDPLTDDEASLNMGAIAISKSNPDIIYAGTGEATWGQSKQARLRDNIYYGRGILFSDSAGVPPGPNLLAWDLRGEDVFDRRTISKIVVHPTNPGIVYAAVGAVAMNGLPGNQGVWKSTDFGQTWQNKTASIGTTDVAVSDLVMDPSNPQVLYAAFGRNEGSAYNGILKSTDGGNSWNYQTTFPLGLFDVNVGRIKIAIAPSAPNTLVATIVTSGRGTVMSGHFYKMFKTTDGGTNWTEITGIQDYMKGRGGFGEGDYDSTLAIDPNNPNRIFAGGSQNVDGNSLSIIQVLNGVVSDIDQGIGGTGPHPDHHGIAFDANGRLLDGNDGGIWRLEFGAGFKWTDINGDLDTVQFTGIALHPTDPNIAYGGTQDNGTVKYTGTTKWEFLEGGDGGYVRVDPSNPNTVYTEMFGVTLFRSDDGGAHFFGKSPPIFNSNEPTQFFVPYILDPARPNRLLYGTDRVYESTNRGDNWLALSAPGSNGWTETDPVSAVAAAASDLNTIYATAGGHIFVTFNRGSTWFERNAGVTDHFSDIQVDPANKMIAYAIRDRFDGGQVWRTTDGGINWIDISHNLSNEPAYSLRLAPNGPDAAEVMYLGNDTGVWASYDGGQIWKDLATAAIPNVQVHEVEYNDQLGIIAAGTNGRGMWQLYATRTETLDGTSGDDVFTLSLDAAQPNHILVDLNGVSQPFFDRVQLQKINVNGLDGNDHLTLDFSNGNFLPPQGLGFDGGNQSGAPGDVLEAIGNAAITGSYVPSGSVHGNGSLTVGGKAVAFTGLEPLIISGFGNFAFTTPNSSDNLTVSAGPGGSTIISGSSGGVPFESLQVAADVSNFVLDTSSNNAPGAQDNIVVAGASLSGDNTMLVNATASDSGTMQLDNGPVIAFAGVASFDFAGDTGNDNLILHNPPAALFAPPLGVHYDGGADNDTLTLTAQSQAYVIDNDSFNSGGSDIIGYAHAENFDLSDGGFQVTGTVTPNFTLGAGATLSGNATITGAVTALAGAAVAPGISPGTLNTGNFTLNAGSSYVVELNGLEPGTEHDLINVTGAVSLGGADLAGSLDYLSVPGDELVIIRNDAADPVSGTFAQGSEVIIGGKKFVIDYAYEADGDGKFNDVALLRYGAELAPDPCDPGQNALFVSATTAGDDIRFLPLNADYVGVQINGVDEGSFRFHGHIFAFGQAGDDRISVLVNRDSFLYGQAGDDQLLAPEKDSVLIGGLGNDLLQGNKGRNVLIGGDGADSIQSGNSGDLLIAAATSYDSNTAANRLALCAIQDEWTHGGNYNDHILHLTSGGGQNGSYVLNAATVSDDGDVDLLRGGKGRDFFIARVNVGVLDIVDKNKDEMILTI